jgi:hypothetical protein
MEIVKQKYLKLSIHRQIQAGVASVTLCVCFLVLFMMILNCFILLNMSYEELLIFLEIREDHQVEELGLYVDSLMCALAIKIKITTQVIRDFVENMKRQPDFVNEMVNLDVNRYMANISQIGLINSQMTSGQTILYKFLSEDFSNNEKFILLSKILAISIPVINRMFKDRYFGLTDTPMFYNFYMLSNEFNTIFYYAPDLPSLLKFNTQYNLTYFKAHTDHTIKYSYLTYTNQTLLLNNPAKIKDTYKLFDTNPFYKSTVLSDTMKFPYINNWKQFNVIISATSIRFKQNFKNLTSEVLLNQKNVQDYMVTDFSPNFLELYSSVSVQKFKGIYFLITNFIDLIITPTNCNYLLKFYRIYNQQNILAKDEKFYYPSDCFKYKGTPEKFGDLFKPEIIQVGSKRKAMLTVANNFLGDPIKFKILRLLSPDFSTRSIFDSNFIFNLRLYIYIFKSERPGSSIQKKIYNSYYLAMILCLLINLAIWIITIIIIIILQYKITYRISKPINYLVKQVTALGEDTQRENNQEVTLETSSIKTKNSLNLLSFPYDKDIDDLFTICKMLIKGGLVDESHHHGSNSQNRCKKLKMINFAYNNISIIKTNNLIIKEDKISNKTSKTELQIFHYKAKSNDHLDEKNSQEDESRVNNSFNNTEENLTDEEYFNFDFEKKKKNKKKIRNSNSNSNSKNNVIKVNSRENKLSNETSPTFINKNTLTNKKNSGIFSGSNINEGSTKKNNKKLKEKKLPMQIYEIIKLEESIPIISESKSYLNKIFNEVTNNGSDIEMIII